MFAILSNFMLSAETAIDKNSAEASGTVGGVVQDTAGAVLQGAQVILQPVAITLKTNAQGAFLITNVKPGTYTLTVSYVGFNTSTTTVVVTRRPDHACEYLAHGGLRQSAGRGDSQSGRRRCGSQRTADV